MKKAINFIKSFSFATLAIALVCSVLGVSLLIWKDTASRLVCMTFGAILIINALIQLVLCFKGDAYSLGKPLLMFSSLIMSVIGVWMLTGPEAVSTTLIFVILGVILLYHGLMDMKFSMYLRGATHKLWYVALLIGFITIGAGVLSLVFFDKEWLSIAVGSSLIFDGVSDIWVVWIMAATKRGTSKMTEVIQTSTADTEENDTANSQENDSST